MNEKTIAMYGRLMDAEALLEPVRRRRGVSETALEEALEFAESSNSETQDDVYLLTLARYVAELGGRIELMAIFPDETVTLLRAPDEPGMPEPT